MYRSDVEIARLCFSVSETTWLVLRGLGLVLCVTESDVAFVGVRTFSTALDP